ncbi:2-succinylbenzoyl-CoA synthetase [Marininema mesophilum]|uniref:2-succinylbenzoate--CoA ligase n=1 Tax=Marininema mesophilum TaxID=1048340 RepID=A0A1H3A0S8_9BACL|nr:o-succinylbenzoate--CoA ligase [Marininema mesophilum]SDX23183.1 2-succinylbenzoyl-CoA synthetase [Marininema mesophilum]
MQSPQMKMPLWLDKRAFLTPERPAIEVNGEKWNWAWLNKEAKGIARRLGSIGVSKGERVALLMDNSLNMVAVIHALSYIGAILVPLNNRLAAPEITWQLLDAEAKLLLYDSAFQEKVAQVDVDKTKVMAWSEMLTYVETDIDLQTHIELSDIHTIMYTSGTTGRPKGVILTYGNHWWSATSSMLNLGLNTEDRWLVCTPMFHMSGLSILLRSVVYGITAVIHKDFDPVKVNQAILQEGVTMVSVVSAMLSRMIEGVTMEGYPDHFRCMLLGGGPAPRPLLEKCRERGIPVFQTYGMTETASQVVTLSPEDSLQKLGSAGKALFPTELRIVMGMKDVAPGEEGEILLRGFNVTQGYWKRQDATEKAIQEGWFRTGDIGRLDEEGYLYVLDRRSDLIISGGENVYPAEIEATLLSHSAVVEAGVTGVPDDRWGEVAIGFVCVSQEKNVAEQELILYCENRLARYKIPRRIYFVKELPRNAANKLMRRQLLHLLSRKQDEGVNEE